MSIKIPIETSARHLHISQEDFEKLFGEGSKPHFIGLQGEVFWAIIRYIE